MWQLYMVWSSVIITDLVDGGVHRVQTSVAGEHMKERWEINTVHVLDVLAL